MANLAALHSLQMSHFYNTVEVLHKKKCVGTEHKSLCELRRALKNSVCEDHSIVHIPTRVSALEKKLLGVQKGSN